MEENITPITLSPTPVDNKTASDPWQIEALIRSAWRRTLDRFVSYFLAIVLSVVIFVAVLIACGIVAAVLIAVSAAFSLTNLGLVSVLLIVLMSLVGYLVLLYVGSLINLLVNEVIIQEEKTGVMETLSKVRPLVWDFVWLSFLMSLFLGGLFIWGVLSLFIVYILWSIWGVFTTFVFLDKRKKGLNNLWLSKTMVSQRFWGIVGRMLLLNVAAFIISSILASSKNSVLELSSVLVSLITQPFLISFSYEMYRNIPEPQNVKRPGIWVGLSVVGYVLFIMMSVVAGSSLMKLFKDFSPQELLNMYKPLQNEQDINKFLPKGTLPGDLKNYLPESLPGNVGDIPANTL